MRAVWLEELSESESYTLDVRDHHHLVTVVRLQEHEKILLLNGKGLQVETIVRSISKRSIVLETVAHHQLSPAFDLNLALGMPKKDALESCLRQAAELGIRRVFLVSSEFSQMRTPDLERLSKILISGLEQSNGAFLPELEFTTWAQIPWDQFPEVLVLASEANAGPQKASVERLGPTLLVVGPEGGFAPSELEFFSELDRARLLRLPTPILRTPTAVAVAAGLVLRRLLDR